MNDSERSKRASQILGRLDKVAEQIQQNHESWGMPFNKAKALVNEIDAIADAIEVGSFGKESFQRRQREVLAQVIQRDPDEGYMQTFESGRVVQQDADEPYMAAYADDDTSGVRKGKDAIGDPLTTG